MSEPLSFQADRAASLSLSSDTYFAFGTRENHDSVALSGRGGDGDAQGALLRCPLIAGAVLNSPLSLVRQETNR